MVRSPLSLSTLSLLFVSSDCMVPEGPLSLSPEESLHYINGNPDFRATVDEEYRLPVRFNLGQQFSDYMTNTEFRMRVLAVVGENRDRVWSDARSLRLRGPQVFDMRDLVELTYLKKLDVAHSKVVNLGALAALGSLEELRLVYAGEQDISELSGLGNLQTLKLHHTLVTGLRQVRGLSSLNYLDLRQTGVTDINELAGFNTTLSQLALAGANFRNVHTLAQLRNLQMLSLTWPDGDLNINDLAGCVRLGTLSLTAAYMRNVHAFSQLPNLGTLSLTPLNRPLHMNELAALNLFSLSVAGETLPNFTVIGQVTNLRHFSVNRQQYMSRVVAPHAQIAAAFPADDKDCAICLVSVENLHDCLLTCSRKQAFHRACLQKCRGRCPLCRAPLGRLP